MWVGWKTKIVGPGLRNYMLATPLLSTEFERFSFNWDSTVNPFALARSKEQRNTECLKNILSFNCRLTNGNFIEFRGLDKFVRANGLEWRPSKSLQESTSFQSTVKYRVMHFSIVYGKQWGRLLTCIVVVGCYSLAEKSVVKYKLVFTRRSWIYDYVNWITLT